MILILILIIFFIVKLKKKEYMTNLIHEKIDSNNLPLTLKTNNNKKTAFQGNLLNNTKCINGHTVILPLKKNYTFLQHTNPMSYLTSNNIYFPPSWIFKPFQNMEKPKLIVELKRQC
jgi:hypothetical protein